jgi:hypothetical protein
MALPGEIVPNPGAGKTWVGRHAIDDVVAEINVVIGHASSIGDYTDASREVLSALAAR